MQDPEYTQAEAEASGYETPDIDVPDKEHRLPIADSEHFEDPDFDAEWNATDGEENSNIVGENSVEEDFQTIGDETLVDRNIPRNFDDDDEWKEV